MEDPEIEVVTVEFIEGLTAKDQEEIAAYQWKVDAMRRADPEGRWWCEPWPLNRDRFVGDMNRPCSCAKYPEDGSVGRHMDHLPKIEHVEGLATEEQNALAGYLRDRDAAEPINWKILRRWRQMQFGNYSDRFVIDKDRDPPIWWDRAAFVESRRVRFDYDEACALATTDASYDRNAADTHRYARERYEEWLTKKVQLPIEEALLAAMPKTSSGHDALRQSQAQRVAHLRLEVHRPHEPPRLSTAAEERSQRLAEIAGMRSRVEEEVAEAERDLAEQAPKLRVLLDTLNPANW